MKSDFLIFMHLIYMKTKQILLLFFLLFIISCVHEEKQEAIKNSVPEVVPATGYKVPEDSISDPVTFMIDESKLIRKVAGKPIVTKANSNIFSISTPVVNVAKTPKIRFLGEDTLILPVSLEIKDSSFIAGIPEVVFAKDPSVKDQNSQNFSSYNKLQGLKHDAIRCMIQDKKGNIWIGTNGGGVSKYDGKSFTNYTVKEGLSNISVWSLIEDSKGNIWMGTYGGGVTKYDGKTFTIYTVDQGICNNRVRSILEDKKGNVWIGTYGGGVSMYSEKDSGSASTFTNYSEKEGLLNNYVYCITEDSKGNIWFGTDKGACMFDSEKFTYYTTNEGLYNNSVWSILEDHNGELWFGTMGGGVSKFNGTEFMHFSEKQGLINNRVWNIKEDYKNNIWFGTDGGVCKFDGNQFTHFTEKEGLSKNSVWSILEDETKNLWFGTLGGGLSKYNGKTFTHFTEKEGLSNNNILSITNDTAGNLWFGTAYGICKYDGINFEIYTENEGLSNNYIRAVLEDRNGNLWVGTSSAGVCKYDGQSFIYLSKKDGLCNNSIWSIFEDKKGNLWFGTNDGASRYDGKSLTNYTIIQGLVNNIVVSMLEDRKGNIWFCTDGGVSRFDGNNFINYTEEEGLPNNSVRSIYEDKDGNVWLGTYGGGLVKYEENPEKKGNDTFTIYTEKDGLSNNYVFCIQDDKKQDILFGTRFGFCKYDVKKNSKSTKEISNSGIYFKSYGYDDGFLGIGVSGGNTICADKTGNIWIGANDRLTVYHPDGDNPDTVPPNIQITSIDLFNEPVEWINLISKKDTSIILGNGVVLSKFYFDDIASWYGYPENLSLNYNNNYITFNFIGITQLQSKKVKYQYKLDGIDDNWSAPSERTEANYGNLPHGTFSFRVKAMNSEGYWSKEFTYTFNIRPPWWKTWWFKVSLVLFGIMLLIVYVKWRERKLKHDKELLERKVKEQTYELQEKNEALNQQKEEIETQRDEIVIQRDLVTNQKEKIEEIYKEVTDSINYAKRIQEAVLAISKETSSVLGEHFIYFKPKNVVSGDFYWIHKKDNIIVVAVADCTGHGVPGAFMSMFGISFLNEIVRNKQTTTAAQILNHLRENIINALQQRGHFGEQQDGMDISLLLYDTVTLKGQWAGANNPLYVIAGNEVSKQSLREVASQSICNEEVELFELKGNKMPIAIYPVMKEFTNNEFVLNKGDLVYLFTDGYADQFGGPAGRKFMNKKFKDLLLGICQQSMTKQYDTLDQRSAEWKTGFNETYPQVDDITVVGIKI